MSLASSTWYQRIAAFLCPEGWPDSYLVVDIETNGTGPSALPLQIAWLSVVDREPVPENSECLLLDWSRKGYGWPAEALAKTITATKDAMGLRGKPYRLSLDLLVSEGVNPREGLKALNEAMTSTVRDDCKIVGFNHASFDMPILARTASHLFDWADYRGPCLLDLGMIEKARINRPDLDPIDEAVSSWYQFVSDERRKGGWNLDLARTRYSLACDPSKAHDAGADCYDTHLLLEAMRGLME